MKQHTSPCHDCPWRRNSIAGWLGSEQTPEDWIASAHGETQVECHIHHPAQCAGVSIYRANMCKMPRFPQILRLKADRENVFATPFEFIEHHRSYGKTSAE